MRCSATTPLRFGCRIHRVVATVLAVLLAVLPRTSHAETSWASLGPVERYTLANGLRVVLSPLPDEATVAVCVTYQVGSGDEPEGQSGFAHLFQHLMFQGTRNVAPGDHFLLLAGRGARAEAVTTKDQTSYFEQLPSGEIELALWLEAERMQRLSLTRENFRRQRALVLDEYRQRYASRPYSKGLVRLHELVFQRYWRYEHPTLGFREDLSEADFRWAKQFSDQFYAPNNAVLTIVGGFDPAHVRALIGQYFAPAAAAPSVERHAPANLPRQTSERLSVIVDRNAKRPGVYYGWRIPEARSRENRALVLLSQILTGGETGVLKEQLVRKEALASTVTSFTSGHRGPDSLNLFVELASRSTVDAMQKALESTLNSLRISGPTDEQLLRAKSSLRLDWLLKLERTQSRALEFGKLEALWGDASLAVSEEHAYDDITRSEVRAAAAKYLLDTRRSIVEVYPPGWVRDIGPPIVTKTYIVKPGDNLTRIAARYGTTPESIAKQNGFGISKRIVVGQRLLVTTNPSKIVKPKIHTVEKGETLIGIGKKYGVEAKDIASMNNLSTKKAIRPGQQLTIPARRKAADATKSSKTTPETKGSTSGDSQATTGKGKSASTRKKSGPETSSADKAAPTRTYVVKAGDSLSVIARKYRVSVRALTRANGISKKRPIRPGQRLVIPEPPQKK